MGASSLISTPNKPAVVSGRLPVSTEPLKVESIQARIYIQSACNSEKWLQAEQQAAVMNTKSIALQWI